MQFDMPRTCKMKNLKDYEQHSFNSLAARFNLLVSRTTLKKWVEDGTLKPAMQQRGTRNSHLLFHRKKLDQLAQLLERGFNERVGRLAKTNAKAVQYRKAALANALRVFELNNKRRAEGLPEMEEPCLATSNDGARGVVRLTREPRKEKNVFTIQNKALGLHR